jgi:hypothetical protein
VGVAPGVKLWKPRPQVPAVQELVVQEVHPANPAEADAGKVVEHAVQPPETEVPKYVTTPEKKK